MSFARRFATLIVSILLPVQSMAIEPLPDVDVASGNPALTASMKGLLRDYLEGLPSKTDMSSSILVDGVTQPWSSNRDTFSVACRADPVNCAGLLRAQFDLLSTELQGANAQRGLNLREVIVISALIDVCHLANIIDMGQRCHPRAKRNMAAWASVGWLSLGQEHLFLEYHDIDLEERSQMRSWLKMQSSLASEDTERALKELQRGKGAEMLDAYGFELRDLPSTASSQWLMVLLQNVAEPDHANMLSAIANLARLAAQQGQLDRVEQWWGFAEGLLTEYPELKDSNRCLLESQHFSIELEHARSGHTPFDGVARLSSLLQHDCPFTTQALEYGLQALRQQQPAQAIAGLQLALTACDRNIGCGISRVQQIKSLFAIAQAQPLTLLREAKYWQNRLKRGQLLGFERRIVWALAAQLHRSGGGTDAGALYDALDDQIDLHRNQDVNDQQTEVTRYEELKRVRVLSDIEQGAVILPEKFEALRGQGLLRRLQSRRWASELAGEVDLVARAELNRQLASIAEMRKNLQKSPSGGSTFARTLAQTLLQELPRLEDLQNRIYLGKLAEKKLKLGWLLGGSALSQYALTDRISASWRNADVDALAANEAYLSWLRVPGGYVGSLLAVTPRNISQRVGMTQHSLRQQFIAFNDDDEAVLQLYRDLLRSGASSNRGVRVTAPMQADDRGLALHGLPLWQLADGSFKASQTELSNGHRMNNFANLSDALFERLLLPFAEHYQDATRLIVSPDGILSYLPFETLTRHGVSVLESVDITYVQSLAVYTELKKRIASRTPRTRQRLLTVADPLYSSSPPETAIDRDKSKSSEPLESLSWPPLPGTRKESAAISSLYQDPHQLLGPKASKSSLNTLQEQRALKDFQILHFATHGYVDDERSALVLSSGPNLLNSYLMDEDIVGWTLDSDLVLLSACNTGIGRQQDGEGVVGLPYAFFMAGNVNTLMSLWPVDDAGTAALMPAFMQRVKNGEGHVTALNNTKRAFARGDYGKAFSNPRVWSAFVLYGVPLNE